MKSRVFFIVILIFVLFAACSSSSGARRSAEQESGPEIGIASMTGGDRVAVRGYSKDPEFNKKMQLLDLEIIDCYKQFVPIGKKLAENTISLDVSIDISGFIESLKVNGNNPVSNEIGECISKDLETLSFRPGEERDISYRLIFKPLPKNKQKAADDPRSKMIMSLSDMKKFKKCYENERALNPGIGGIFSLNFKVDEDGNVLDIKIVSNTFLNNKVPLCVVKKLADTVFPESESEDTVEVNFKFETSTPAKKRKSMDINM